MSEKFCNCLTPEVYGDYDGEYRILVCFLCEKEYQPKETEEEPTPEYEADDLPF